MCPEQPAEASGCCSHTSPPLKHPYPTSTVTLRRDGVSLTATNLPDNVKRSNIAVRANDKSCLNRYQMLHFPPHFYRGESLLQQERNFLGGFIGIARPVVNNLVVK